MPADDTGLIIVVDTPTERVVDIAAGLADRATDRPMTSTTRAATASAAKGITALCVGALVDGGALELDDAVIDMLGDRLPTLRPDVTVRHLLSHTSGVGDYLPEEEEDDLEAVDFGFPTVSLDSVDAHLELVAPLPPAGAPGDFAYNNSGFVILGAIVERLTQSPLHEVAADLVFGPARMLRSAILRTDQLTPDDAVGYLADGQPNDKAVPRLGGGDGGLWTTPDDLCNLWAALLDGQIVSPATVEEMLTDHRPDVGSGFGGLGYGLGFWLHRDEPIVRLEGMDAGISMVSMHHLVSRSTATVIANTMGGAWPIVAVFERHAAALAQLGN